MTTDDDALAERIAYIEGRLGTPWRVPNTTARAHGDTAVDWREGGRPWSAWMRGRSDASHERTDRNFRMLAGLMVALYAVVIVGVLTLLSR